MYNIHANYSINNENHFPSKVSLYSDAINATYEAYKLYIYIYINNNYKCIHALNAFIMLIHTICHKSLHSCWYGITQLLYLPFPY